MVDHETRDKSIYILLSGIFYVIIYTLLVNFIYPVDNLEGSNILSRVLGSAFFFGIFSGFFTGIMAGLLVNRLNLKSPLSSGLKAGMLAAVVGSLLFPPVGAIVRIVIFGENPADLLLNISFLMNFSLIGIWPGIFVSFLTGSLGGALSSDISAKSKQFVNQ